MIPKLLLYLGLAMSLALSLRTVLSIGMFVIFNCKSGVIS